MSRFRSNQRERVEAWRDSLAGRTVVISFQTRAEVLAGVLTGNWGQPRRDQALKQLDSTPTVGLDEEVVQQYASPYAACRRTGHALAAKQHTADRWIAASAIAKGLPLLSGDRLYSATPGLLLLGEDQLEV